MKHLFIKAFISVVMVSGFSITSNAEFIYIGDATKVETASSAMEEDHSSERRGLLPHAHGLDTNGANGMIKGVAKNAPFDVVKNQLLPDGWSVRCDTCDGSYSWNSNGEDWKTIFTRAFPDHAVEYNDKSKTIAMFPLINGKKAWSVRKGENAEVAINRWNVRNGWGDLVWSASKGFPIMVDYSFLGSYKSAIIGLVRSLNASGDLRLRPVFYSNNVVKIKEVNK